MERRSRSPHRSRDRDDRYYRRRDRDYDSRENRRSDYDRREHWRRDHDYGRHGYRRKERDYDRREYSRRDHDYGRYNYRRRDRDSDRREYRRRDHDHDHLEYRRRDHDERRERSRSWNPPTKKVPPNAAVATSSSSSSTSSPSLPPTPQPQQLPPMVSNFQLQYNSIPTPLGTWIPWMSWIPPPPPLPPPLQDENTDHGSMPSTKFYPLPGRPVIRGKSTLPRVADDWGHGKITDYELIAAVGEGTYGKVYKAKHLDTGDFVALKKIRLEIERDGFPITAVREIKILRQLDHANVIKLIDVVIETSKKDATGNSIEAFYLVFEYMSHDLHGIIESKYVTFTDAQLGVLFKQLLLGLEHCHAKNFLHRDIKCSNILLNNKGQIKLADFGLARLYHKHIDRLYTNRVVTLWYRPPELLLGLEKYGPAVDIWSIGCILGELFLKKPMFMGTTETQMLDIISQTCGSPSPEVWPGVEKLPLWSNIRLPSYTRNIKDKYSTFPTVALDLLDKMLQLDPSTRPSASQALQHPWMQKIDINKIPPPQLPQHQDCHEMWSKKIRRSNQHNSSIPSQSVHPYSNSSGNGRSGSHHHSRRSNAA